MGAPPTTRNTTMGSLMGSTPQAQQQGQPDAQQRAQAVMRQVRDLSMSVQGLARQFPAAAESARQVADGLKQMMVAIVSDLNKTQESPPSPPVAG